MKYFLLMLLSFSYATSINAQATRRPVSELIDTTESGWTLVQAWIKTSKNKVEVLPANADSAKAALFQTQVTTRSPMGAIVYNTGGILVDDGWIRILGSGSERLKRSLPSWNLGKSFAKYGDRPKFLLIADDAVGGFFLLNGGDLGKDTGIVYYLSPDYMEYERLDINYSQFLELCFNRDLDAFYQGKHWEGWKPQVSKLDGDRVYTFYPYLYTKEGSDINKCVRYMIPMEEHYKSMMDLKKKTDEISYQELRNAHKKSGEGVIRTSLRN